MGARELLDPAFKLAPEHRGECSASLLREAARAALAGATKSEELSTGIKTVRVEVDEFNKSIEKSRAPLSTFVQGFFRLLNPLEILVQKFFPAFSTQIVKLTLQTGSAADAGARSAGLRCSIRFRRVVEEEAAGPAGRLLAPRAQGRALAADDATCRAFLHRLSIVVDLPAKQSVHAVTSG